MKKIIIGITVLLSLIFFCACSTGTQRTNGFNIEDCVVIYSADASDKIVECAENIANFLSIKTNTKINARNDEYSGDAGKIIIGSGESDFAKKSTENLKSFDYVVCTDNKELVLGATNDSSLKNAVSYFCDNYLSITKDNVFSAENNYEYRYDHPVKEFTVNGENIEGFSIVYPENKGTYAEKYTPEKYAAQNLQNKIADACGVELPLVSTNEIPDKAIVISSVSGDKYSYSYKTENSKLTFNAGGVYAYSAVFEKLLSAQGEKLNITGEGKEENVMTERKNSDFVYYGTDTASPAIASLTLNDIDIGEYKIIYPKTDSKNPYSYSEKTAAENLQKYIGFATGKKLEISDDKAEQAQKEILIGHTNREASNTDGDFGDEEYIIQAFNEKLVITGGEKRGTLYGVFSFLEEYIGYSFIASDTEILYKRDNVDIPSGISDRSEPSYEFRDICTNDSQDENYSIRRKLNSFYRRDLDYSYGSSFKFTGELVHTFGTVLGVCSPDKQPCLTDEETYNTVLRRARTLLNADPNASVISVTQNDNNKYCTCAECANVNNEEGSTGGTQMRFINRLATELKIEFPDVRVLTLAYMYSIKPTKTKPVDNVIVEYCPLESCCNHSLNDFTCKENQKYYKYATEWAQMTDNLYIWYYTTDFKEGSREIPFMNFGAIYDNFKFFYGLGVKGIFCEGLINDESREFSVARSYLMSRLMWDADMSREEYNGYLTEFMRAYYGSAGDMVLEYFDLLSENSYKKHFNEGSTAGAIFDRSNLKVLSEELNDWFNRASKFRSDAKISKHLSLLNEGFGSLLKKLS